MKRFVFAAAALLALCCWAENSYAQQKIRIAYIRSNTYIPYLQAQKMGYFKREGLDPEVIMLNNGPAQIAALVSGSADIAMVASIPVISARAQGQPIRMFMTYNIEGVPPWPNYTHLLASGRSGAKTMEGLKGKTVASNAAGGGCDLMIRDHLHASGLAVSDIKIAVLPFPQMQAALELGTVDAACLVDPFYTAVKQSPRIAPVDVAQGMIADLARVGFFAQDGYVGGEDWLTKNPKIAASFMRAIQSAARDLASDPALYRGYLENDFKMAPAITAGMMLELNTTHMVAEPKDYQPAIDAMVRTQMLEKPLSATDLVATIKP